MKVNKYKKIKNVSLLTYYCLVVIRIVLVFIPQYGYIHPDEFFQSSEIISGEFEDTLGSAGFTTTNVSSNRRNVSIGGNENLGIQ